MTSGENNEDIFVERLEYLQQDAEKVAQLIKKAKAKPNKFLLRDLSALIYYMKEDIDFIVEHTPA